MPNSKKGLIMLWLLFHCLIGLAQQSASIVIESGSSSFIDKNIYGHFAEHLGRCIYDGFYKDGKIRMDIVDALKKIKMPVLRWPGGCFADQYHWSDAIGPKKGRIKTVNTTWGMVAEDNSFGTQEFLTLCDLIGCDPYIAGNVGTGTPKEMEDWVEYLNFSGKSSLSGLRVSNGHAQPYKVHYWGVGNESWGCGGNMTAEVYAEKYKQYAEFCKSYPGSPLFRIASGANGDDYAWTETLMKNIPNYLMQGISLHYYTMVDGWYHKESATDFTEKDYFKSLKNALFIDSLIDRHTLIMDKYDPRKKVALIVDEWGIWTNVEPGTNPSFLFQQNSLRDALIAASTLNIFNNHCERIKMANLAQTVNVLQSLVLTRGDNMLLTPTYFVFDMYKVHQGARWLSVKIESPNYYFNYEGIPAVNASASLDSNNKIHITFVNIDPQKKILVTVSFGTLRFTSISGQLLSSEKFNDINSFDQPEKISIQKFNDVNKQGEKLIVLLPAKSVVTLELK